MLSALRIENFALIERLELELMPGLNVLTGETGAGKSIIIDAVSLLLGGRGSQEFIRSGSERALVEGLFVLPADTPLIEKLASLGYELEEGSLLLSRELAVSGRNLCRIQGRVAPLNLYKEIGVLLVDIHGQHDYQSLLRPENHLSLLDSMSEETKPLLLRVREKAASVIDIRQKISQLASDDRDTARREDMLKFQIAEIAGARLESGEEEELVQERQKLVNAEKLALLSGGAYEKLFTGSERQQSALDLTGAVLAHLKELAGIDAAMFRVLEGVESAYYQLEEAAAELRLYQESLVFDPRRLDQVDERLTLIKSLKRKYGSSIAEIKAYYAEAAAELEQLSRQEDMLQEYQKLLEREEQDYRSEADGLSLARRKVAAWLEQDVTEELTDLQMPGTKFKVEFEVRDKVSKSGRDIAEFAFSPNPGEPLKALAKTASGGELSRVILALKTILANIDPVPTLIFDEVDSGVGGQAVRKVAEKLARIGQTRQVLCITHSPHVASFGARHFFISKEVLSGRTVTRVKTLGHEERQRELARMLGGESKATMEHAAEMLRTSKAKS